MKYTIYKTTNILNGKYYVGKHQTENVNDNYLGSGVALKSAIKKFGKDSFTKEILFIFDKEYEMNKKEKEIVTEEFKNNKKTYNIGVGGEGGAHFKGKKHSKETKDKLSKIGKKRVFTEETKQKISEANKNRIISEKTRQKLSEKAKLRFWSEESKIKHSKRMKKYYKTCGERDGSL